VSSQHEKDQQLSMNPTKITGNCDRYLCCLAYEEESYLDAYTRIPRAGSYFTPENQQKRGEVIFVDIFKERIQVKFLIKNKDEKPTTQYEWFNLEQVNAGKVEEARNYQSKGKENEQG
jgi:cell fate regulator YaaT (PSP1 superfamily)